MINNSYGLSATFTGFQIKAKETFQERRKFEDGRNMNPGDDFI